MDYTVLGVAESDTTEQLSLSDCLNNNTNEAAISEGVQTSLNIFFPL